MAQLVGVFLQVAALLLLIPSLGSGAAADKDLEGLKTKIERERQGLSRVQSQEGSILQALSQIESSLDKKTRDLRRANANFESISREVERLEADEQRIKESVKQREGLLQKRAVALYRWHRGGNSLVLLNGDLSLGAFLQHQRYLQTTLSYDRELVQKLVAEAKHHEALKASLEQQKIDLDSLRQALTQLQDGVRQEAANKKEILASVRQEKDFRVRALRELEQAAARLQQMMKDLSKQASIRPPDFQSGSGLGLLHGKLDWPVRGALKREFGKTKHREFATEVFRNGIDIEAPLGEAIHAIERGKIVFADRLAGYGKMVIVDHGERYYTIYAHLLDFSKKNGDAVRRGEPIGQVGDSDSLSGAVLYFEMRKDGRSIDPLPWFKK